MKLRVVRPTSESEQKLRASGYASVAHVPFFLAEDGSYPAVVNRYIRARALGEWPLGPDGQARVRTRNYVALTKASLDAVVYRLARFFAWLDGKQGKIDLVTVAYEDLLDWQREMVAEKKSESTIHAYISEACLHLTWLGQIPKAPDGSPIRPPFDPIYREFDLDRRAGSRSGRGHNLRSTLAGVKQPYRRPIVLPSDEAIALWLKRMRVRSEVKAMMAQAIMDSGMRLSEANQMPRDDLPERTQWRPIGGRVHFRINRGVKGAKLTPSSSIAIRDREISFSLELANMVEAYRRGPRELQIRRWIRSGETKRIQASRAAKKPQRLWLSEFTNEPFSNVTFRDIWTEEWKVVRDQMPEEPRSWTPHGGRHWFAVDTLISAAASQHEATRQGFPNLTWLEGVMRNQIDLMLRPQMGHLSDETTRLYLRAAQAKMEERSNSPSLRWQLHLDGDEA